MEDFKSATPFPTGVTTIEKRAFYACQRLMIITFPSSVKRIENEVFAESVYLERVTHLGMDESDTLRQCLAFYDCSRFILLRITFVDGSCARGHVKKCFSKRMAASRTSV